MNAHYWSKHIGDRLQWIVQMAIARPDRKALIDRISALAESLVDPEARCSAFLDIALARTRLGENGVEQALNQAVECVGRITEVNEKIRLLCDIALAQPLLQKSSVSFLDKARTLAATEGQTGRFRVALTEALLTDRQQRSFARALAEAGALPAGRDRSQAFADVAFSQMETGDFEEARKTNDAIGEPYETAHMFAELALAEHRAVRNGSDTLAIAQRIVEALQEPDRKLEARCFIAVALAALDPQAALRMLLAIQDEADLLPNPVLAAHVNCQIAAAKAQMGLLEQAKLRAERIPDGSYRDSAWRSIASEEAQRGSFEDAIESVREMREPHLRERALARVIGIMARVSVENIEKVGPRDASRGPV